MTIPAPARARVADSGYGALAREIRQLGLMERRNVYYGVLLTVLLSSFAAVVTVMVLARGSWWLILLAPVLAVLSTQFGFVGHDAAHRQIARSSGRAAVLGLVHGNLLSGFSYGWWVAKHNAHHAQPNDLDTDPDVAAGAFVFDEGQATVRRGLAAVLTRHQAAIFFPMLLLEAMNLHLSGVRAVLRPGLRRRPTEAGLLVAHFVGYGVLLLTTMTWAQALVFLAVHQGLFGVYLGCTFAPSHKGMPVLGPDEAADPLLRQVLTSRNLRGGVATDLVYGGLDLQIEHHLFPAMPRPNLRRAQPVVRRFCRERGVPYTEVTPFEAYRLGLRHLHAVGAGLRRSQAE